MFCNQPFQAVVVEMMNAVAGGIVSALHPGRLNVFMSYSACRAQKSPIPPQTLRTRPYAAFKGLPAVLCLVGGQSRSCEFPPTFTGPCQIGGQVGKAESTPLFGGRVALAFRIDSAKIFFRRP